MILKTKLSKRSKVVLLNRKKKIFSFIFASVFSERIIFSVLDENRQSLVSLKISIPQWSFKSPLYFSFYVPDPFHF